MRAKYFPGWVLAACALAACGSTGRGAVAGRATPGNTTAAIRNATTSASAGADHPARQSTPRFGTFQALLVPLTADDVHFYLTVMHAAAYRKEHPTASDAEALQIRRTHAAAELAASRYNASIIAAQTARAQSVIAAVKAAQASGNTAAMRAAMAKAPRALPIQTVPDVDPAVARHATLLSVGAYDILILEERHLDEDRYDRVKADIDEVYSPIPGVATCGGGDCGHPHWTAAQLRNRKQLAAAEARNRETLAPYATQIRAAQAAAPVLPPTTQPP